MNPENHNLHEADATENADRIFQCIKSLEGSSSKVSAWSLTIMGGSFLAILSDSYIHPGSGSLKMVYLLFILAWISISLSLYYGMRISGSAVASDLYSNKISLLKTIFKKCNSEFASQLKFKDN